MDIIIELIKRTLDKRIPCIIDHKDFPSISFDFRQGFDIEEIKIMEEQMILTFNPILNKKRKVCHLEEVLTYSPFN